VGNKRFYRQQSLAVLRTELHNLLKLPPPRENPPVYIFDMVICFFFVNIQSGIQRKKRNRKGKKKSGKNITGANPPRPPPPRLPLKLIYSFFYLCLLLALVEGFWLIKQNHEFVIFSIFPPNTFSDLSFILVSF
jgi:hypothetical protein